MKTHALCFGVLALLATTSCTHQTGPVAEAIYPVASPVVADTADYDEYVAQITSLQNVEVRSRVKGFMDAIQVDEGQFVHEGQVLFSISNRVYEQEAQKAKAEVLSAAAELTSAQVELDNTQRLLAKDIVAAPELTAMKAKVASLEAQVAQAKSEAARADLELSYTEIRAPFDGIIDRLPIKRGSLVDEGMLLTTISNNKDVYAYFNLSERDYLNHITAGDDARSKGVALVLANGAPYMHKGVIETIESEFNEGTGNIAFRARFPNPEGLLKHGGTGKVRVRTPIKQALIIPQQATFEVQGNIYVYVLDKENKARMRQVMPSHRLDHIFVLSSGLTAEDRFVLNGAQTIKEGDLITPEKAHPAEMAEKRSGK
ncbi:MAG: efflux RND transporter periplasmic adaptor subunit [Flavobacteriales bacterium]